MEKSVFSAAPSKPYLPVFSVRFVITTDENRSFIEVSVKIVKCSTINGKVWFKANDTSDSIFEYRINTYF